MGCNAPASSPSNATLDISGVLCIVYWKQHTLEYQRSRKFAGVHYRGAGRGSSTPGRLAGPDQARPRSMGMSQSSKRGDVR
eukprot:jgi/Botrbrau1/18053/Bobra.0062s0041.1